MTLSSATSQCHPCVTSRCHPGAIPVSPCHFPVPSLSCAISWRHLCSVSCATSRCHPGAIHVYPCHFLVPLLSCATILVPSLSCVPVSRSSAIPMSRPGAIPVSRPGAISVPSFRVPSLSLAVTSPCWLSTLSLAPVPRSCAISMSPSAISMSCPHRHGATSVSPQCPLGAECHIPRPRRHTRVTSPSHVHIHVPGPPPRVSPPSVTSECHIPECRTLGATSPSCPQPCPHTGPCGKLRHGQGDTEGTEVSPGLGKVGTVEGDSWDGRDMLGHAGDTAGQAKAVVAVEVSPSHWVSQGGGTGRWHMGVAQASPPPVGVTGVPVPGLSRLSLVCHRECPSCPQCPLPGVLAPGSVPRLLLSPEVARLSPVS